MPVSKTVVVGSNPTTRAIGSLVKWIITQRYGRWVKGSNPLGATQVRDGVRMLIKPLCND